MMFGFYRTAILLNLKPLQVQYRYYGCLEEISTYRKRCAAFF
jgi:hypothetical protein